MRKLLSRIFAVLAVAVAFYVLAVALLFTFGNVNWLPNVKYTLGGTGYTLLRLQEAKKQKDIEVLFIGSSQVYRGFDTRLFEERGISAFNLGTSSQTPADSYYLLRENLQQFNPKVVVMDLFWEILAEEGVEAGVDIISNSEISNNMVEMVWHRKDPMLLNTLLLSGARSTFKPLDPSDQEQFEEYQYVPGGFAESHRRENKLSPESLSSLRPYTFTTAEMQLNYIRKIAELCAEQQVILVFVVAPVTKELKDSVENYDAYTAVITKLAQESNANLIDYNIKPGLKLSSRYDFLDANHLSQSGVIKFNKLLLSDLQRIVPTLSK
ncbi:hypothetical protein [Pontibacter cellulosilyticus]|uniref:SGNH/GDSL hydrolase family protein n=1 Tax=Pontibacter cellulosilyticus TaxID=1720253 RepID=A0A923NA36_9BACT|nr:hypothetical protein [Pontibacter cellulosilyticus]MBC5994983.1 hypothetical protein [Pontibacter cellulosilyticus]